MTTHGNMGMIEFSPIMLLSLQLLIEKSRVR
jgi:hypothetical protein